ncbi:MAG TPA: hypothetical protein VEY95_06425 [Azospirillaceae bacterium]|nr:hypothetical protein [Azospirillaceae bacterium]
MPWEWLSRQPVNLLWTGLFAVAWLPILAVVALIGQASGYTGVSDAAAWAGFAVILPVSIVAVRRLVLRGMAFRRVRFMGGEPAIPSANRAPTPGTAPGTAGDRATQAAGRVAVPMA